MDHDLAGPYYQLASADWARQWPVEEIWHVGRAPFYLPINLFWALGPQRQTASPRLDEYAAEAMSVAYQPSSRSRLSSMPKWWPISWMTVRRTWPATSCSVPQIAQMAWR
jgi:hypothetical protein